MLLLENCTSAWPMPEMQSQIDALREAFSADINKPFRLRHNFPHGSPRAPLKHSQSEPAETKYPPTLGRQTSHEQSARIRYGTQPLTPPISAGLEDTNSGSMNLGMLPNSHHQGPHIDNLGFDHSEWNPSKIFEFVSWPRSSRLLLRVILGIGTPPSRHRQVQCKTAV